MDRIELKNWLLKNIYKQTGSVNFSRVTETWFEDKVNILSQIKSSCPFLSENSTIYQNAYCIVNDILDSPKCICGQLLVWQRTHYSKYCCSSCANKHTAKHGKDAHIASKEVQEKKKQTFLKNYGVDNPFKNKEIQQKIRETNQEKFGGPAPACSPEIVQKAKQTSIERYGVEHYSRTKEFREKITKFNQRNIPPEVLEKIDNKDWLYEQHITLKKTHMEIARDMNVCQAAISERFGKFDLPVNYNFSTSSHEKEIENFLNELNVTFERNTRNVIPPKELDFYFPNHKLAIEYNGIYWHSSKHISKKHHKDKTDLCLDQQIQLLHIFEHDWETKKEIWKSIIKNKLNILEKKIFARKCLVQQVSPQDSRDFLQQNHLQGKVKSQIHLGLYYNDELVSLMTFSKCNRFTKKYEWELMRFCNKINTLIIGGSSKLFSYFIKNYSPNSILSYADRTHSNGHLYQVLGFTFSHTSSPNYYYLIGNNVEHRQNWQKKLLSKKLSNYDSSLTEEQNMINHGYYRLYNSGNLVFVWSK